MRTRFSCSAVGVILSFFLLLADGFGQQTPTVIVGSTASAGDGAIFISQEKGYFEELGIQVKTAKFGSGAAMMAPLAGNKIQTMVSGGINPALFNAVARGLPIVLVAGGGEERPGYDGLWFMLRPDLKDEIKGIRDLKGRTFALNASGSPSLYVLAQALKKEGLALKDVNVKVIGFGDMAAAFKTKAIDFSLQVEPLATIEIARKISVRWLGVSDVIKDPWLMISAVYFNSDWARNNVDLARRFMVGYLKGAREFLTASRHGPNRAEVVNILLKHSTVKDPNLFDAMEWSYRDANGQLNIESIRQQQDWWHEQGLVTTKVPMEKLVDTSFSEYALKRLGEFK